MSRLNLNAIALGVVVAVLISTGIDFILPLPTGELTDPATIFTAVAGLVAFLPGGYVTGRIAGDWGGLNGLLTAVAGFVLVSIVNTVLAVTGLSPTDPNEFDPDAINVVGASIAAGISFLLTFLGGYLGGKLGERTASGRTG